MLQAFLGAVGVGYCWGAGITFVEAWTGDWKAGWELRADSSQFGNELVESGYASGDLLGWEKAVEVDLVSGLSFQH